MKKHLGAFLIFFLLLAVVTFPLIFKITTHIPGFFSTVEPFTDLADSWRVKFSWQNSLPLSRSSLVGYPFCTYFFSAGFVSYLWLGLFYGLSIFTTPVVTFNLQVFLNFFLSAAFTYLLVFHLTGSRPAAFFSGMIFAFCPYQFAIIWQYIRLSYNQWIPLALYAAVLMKERPSRRRGVLFFLSLLFLFSFDYSIMYLGMVTLLVFFVYLSVYHWRLKLFKDRSLIIPDLKYLKTAALLVLIVFVLLAGQFIPIIKNRFIVFPESFASAHNPYHRPFEDLFKQSARPLSYLLPSPAHPLFGKFTQKLVGSTFYGNSFIDHSLYLGLVPLILALTACLKWKKRRRERLEQEAVMSDNADFYIGFFIFLGIFAWLFSQPPWWRFGQLKIYMPSFFMYKLLPMFRAYCRFGIVLMLSVAVLAGFGLRFILDKFRGRRPKVALALFFSGLVLFEFWNWPPYKVIDVSRVPEVYYWLKQQGGDFAIAEYPLDSDSPNGLYRFYQTEHEKKIINGSIPGTRANRIAKAITKLSELRTAQVLSWLGVRYVIVHRDDYLNTELIEDRDELNTINHNPGLKFLKSFSSQRCGPAEMIRTQEAGPIDVYKVSAGALDPKIE